MGSLTVWLLALATPLVKRVLIALGIGVITYAGIDTAFSLVTSQIQSNLGGITGDLANLIALSGTYESIGIILAAISARLSFAAVSKMGRVL